jgi:hypothetical protein
MATIFDTTLFLMHTIEKLQTQLKNEQDKYNNLLKQFDFEKPKLIRSTNEYPTFTEKTLFDEIDFKKLN